MILTWDKPERAMPVEEWQKISADSAPPGVYSPNMSNADMLRWKAKLVGKKGGIAQVEIRKTTDNGTQVLIVVSMDGFRYKGHRNITKEFPGKNIRISQNGPAAYTFEELTEMNQAVQEAKEVLERL